MKEAIQLLQFWQEYLEMGHQPNLERFSVWLQNKLKKQHENEKMHVPGQYMVSQNMAIGFLLGNVMAYAEIWIKATFRNLPIQHFHDFGTLKFIEEKRNPTKKEVAEDSLLEQSSCFEAIKRMTKSGLLKDQEDKKDKRVRRVSLTAKGKKVIEDAMQQAYHLSELLVGDLTEEEKEGFIKVLQKLGSFHEDLYRSGGKDKAISQYGL